MSDWWNRNVGDFVAGVRDLYEISTKGFTADETNVRRWERGVQQPNHANLLEIRSRLGLSLKDLRDAAEGKGCPLETFAHTHPHSELLWDLRFGIQDRRQREVLGPPGMLYDKVCDAIILGLSRSGVQTVRINAAGLTFDQIRRECAEELDLSRNATEDDFAFVKEAREKDWVLLVEGLDQLCARLYNRTSRRNASDVISAWISQIMDIRKPTLIFGTMKIRTLVVLADASANSLEPVKFDKPRRCTSWVLWSKTIADGLAEDKIKEIKECCNHHPTAFLEGLKYLRDHPSCDERALKQLVLAEHQKTAESVYHMLPQFVRPTFRRLVKDGTGNRFLVSALSDAGIDTGRNQTWTNAWSELLI